MGRVINPENAGKDRTRLVKMIGIAVRELARKQEVDTETRDLAAYIVLSMDMVWETIDQSVVAWEKRGYWVKADRFRYEWSWTQRYSGLLRDALVSEDWGKVAQLVVEIAAKLAQVKLPARSVADRPWTDAWVKLSKGIIRRS